MITSTASGLATRTRSHPLVLRAVLALITALAAVALVFASSTAPAIATGSKAWGGYQDGEIPTKVLTKVAGSWLRPDAASAYASFTAAFDAKFHKQLTITQGYRDLADQESIFIARNTPNAKPQKNSVEWAGKYWVRKPNTSIAAIPGTSVHGWALAADFGSKVQIAGSTEKKWADANGPKYGWYPIGNTFGEAWHFEFTPLPKKSAPTK